MKKRKRKGYLVIDKRDGKFLHVCFSRENADRIEKTYNAGTKVKVVRADIRLARKKKRKKAEAHG